MKYFSMFSGIGGFEYGIDQACNNRGFLQVEKTENIQGDMPHLEGGQARFTCIGYSEVDKYAKQIYRRHYPNHTNYGDATQIRTGELPDFDLLVGGFPCQAFSVAGKQRGFCDTRGTLFFEISRVLEDKRPGHFLLENVRGLLSNDGGKTFQTILEILTDLGYGVEWQVLNSKDFGVPQNRERVFIIGHLRGIGGREVFPLRQTNSEAIDYVRKSDKKDYRTFSEEGIAPTLQARSDTHKLQQVGNIDEKGHNSLWGRVYDPDGISANLNAHGGGLGAKTGLYAIPSTKDGNCLCLDSNYHKGLDNHNQRSGVAVPVLTPDREKKRQNGRRFKEDGEPAFTLTQQDKHGGYDGYRIRRLTPTECERLQGFPDNWTKTGGNGQEISDTQRYKCLGNAVTTNVITAIITKMMEVII